MRKALLVSVLVLCALALACKKESFQQTKPADKQKTEKQTTEKRNDEDNKNNDKKTENKNEGNNTNDNNKNLQPEITDYYMAKRAVATWKKDVDPYKDFDFDEIIRLGKTEKFTTEYMSKLIELSSSSPDGKIRHTFTEEDLKNTKISDLKFTSTNNNEGQISFVITYKGVKGSSDKEAPSLLFDKSKYYSNLITVNKTMAANYYMRGVYEHLDIFLNNLLDYDKNKFGAIVEHKQRSDNENNISVQIKFFAMDKEKTVLANIPIKLSGFKPLTDLVKELSLYPQRELNIKLKKILKDKKSDAEIFEALKNLNIKYWFNNMQVAVREFDSKGTPKHLNDLTLNGNIFESTSSLANDKHVYLENPIFEIVGVEKYKTEDSGERRYYIYLKLRQVNEVEVKSDGKIQMIITI